MSKNHIRENIKFLRLSKSMTQEEFGALFGVSRDNIASYERGTEPKIDFIIRLVDLFDIPYKRFIEMPLGEFPESEDYKGLPEYTQAQEPDSSYDPEPAEKHSGWQNIPIYELPNTRKLTQLFEEPQSFQPIDYVAGCYFPRCDGGLKVNGDSMAPLVKPGDVVLYKQVNDIHNAILWGEMYLLSFEVDGDEYTMVKYLHESDRPECVRLVSFNSRYAPKEIAISQIRALAVIRSNIQIHL